MRSKLSLLFIALAAMIAVPAAAALASDVDVTSVVDVTTPNGAVTLEAGQSENITINMAVSGSQAGTATFEVNQDYELQHDAVTNTYNFVGSNPKEFTVNPQSGGTTTNFSTTGKVSVASGVPAGGPRTLTVKAFDITNSNTSGGKLAVGKSATYAVTVAAPSDTTAPKVTAIARTTPSPTNTTGNLSWDVTFSESVTGVDSSDFQLAKTGLSGTPQPAITSVTPSSGASATYTVTASSGSGDGTLGLNLVDDNSIKDGANNLLVGASSANGSFTGEIYTIDRTKPVITASAKTLPDEAAYTAGTWTNKDVQVSFSCTDNSGSTNTNTVAGETLSDEGADQSVKNTGSCTDNAGNIADSATFSNIDIDKTAPEVSPDDVVNTTWRNTDLAQTFTASDDLSDLANSADASFALTASAESQNSTTPTVVSKTVTDAAGNSTTRSVSALIDKSAPTLNPTVSPNPVILNGPATASANASDTLSGVLSSSCDDVNTGTIGSGQTVSCSATDKAGNSKTANATYGVKAAFDGFLQPIDGHSVNTGKFGRTYPIKWQLRDSSGALISDSAAQALVGTMTGGQKSASCTSFDLSDTDALEESTTGNTALRYDATSDQFIYNYKAPTSGSCYVFAIRNADGLTTQQVDFKFTK